MVSKTPIFRVPISFSCMIFTITSILLIMTKTSLARETPEDYLEPHNAARAEVGAGPLTWSEELASYARRYAESHAGDCRLVHSDGPYGENLAWGSGDVAGPEAVQWWIDEKRNFDSYSNSCSPGEECGHYIQVISNGSARLGCAKVSCDYGGTFITCNYDPPAGSY